MRAVLSFNAALLVCVFMALPLASLAARASPAAKRVRGGPAGAASSPNLLHVDLGEGEARSESNPLKEMSKVVQRRVNRERRERAFGKKLPSDIHVVDKLKCGETVTVQANTDKDSRCPDTCPFLAQNKNDDMHCTFHCVADAAECRAMNPKTVVPDEDRGICRKPSVMACKVYNMDGTDTCKECETLYYVGTDGLCYGTLTWMASVLGIVLLLVVVFLVVWICDLIYRPIKNMRTLKEAINFRSYQKNRMPKEEGRGIYPLSTNLLRKTVAGAGMMLHFNFQFLIICWASMIAIGWVVMALLVDDALLIMGTRRFGTPFTNCVLVAWGYEMQQSLMWTKILFLVVTYLGSFLGSLLHSVRQLRMFQNHDFKNKTMKDFVVQLEGVPPTKGSEHLEEQLQACIEKACGERPIGVSVGWDYEEQESLINQLLEDELEQREEEHRVNSPRPGYILRRISQYPTVSEETGMVRKYLFKLEDTIFGPGKPEEPEKTVKDILEDLTSSPVAFAVFQTEEVRDAVLEKLEDTGIEFNDTVVKIQRSTMEPETVQWRFLGNTTTMQKVVRLLKGFLAIFVALIFWTVVFYLPYAWSIFSFNYDNGQEPGIIYSLAFSMVVVVGNQIMYEVCARVAENVGFRDADNRAACYMILFTVACLYNVLVDMVTTYFMSEQIMMELGFRTYYGTKLKEVGTFSERFETYAMQRTLAENSFGYAFPSTFLVPFLLEPIFTIFVPLKLGIWIVRSHPEIQGRDAENLVASIPMDMGRYADILLNVLLGILIFYFPGGYTHWLFLGMAVSHSYVYFFDHCRVLRTVPSLMIATMDVDWWSQFMLAPCCGLIASCTFFKTNCQGYGYCLTGLPLIAGCSLAFIGHCAIHWLLLLKVVPLFGKTPPEEDPCKGMTFGDLASRFPCSWFTSNALHCLRSHHIYEHNPPCRFLFSGKEHLLKVNKEIGCYFEDTEATPEDYSGLTGERTMKAEAQAQLEKQ
mmetsp:Transcript_14901/g.42783  ORF Transcript_14901/g.42783 Transcript_14901/m.42783 type:complete len:981 (+) Transcript_14901:87-3029(+)